LSTTDHHRRHRGLGSVRPAARNCADLSADARLRGWLLISSGQVMETEKVFASLIVLAVVGAVVIKLQQWIDRKVASWVAHG
jgi:ABC-type nitrate/sulfonate/bicarbonate transport system permease component